MVDEGCALSVGGTDYADALRGKVVGLYFRQPSTRTRTSFFVAVHRMGGVSIQYGPGDLQLENGESIGDTAMIFDQVLDSLVVRTNGPESELRALAGGGRNLAVINALSEGEHPTQAIADLITIQQEFGSLAGRHILYIGAANNTSGSLLLAASRIPGLQITMVEPVELRSPAPLVELARANARQSGAVVSLLDSPDLLPAPAEHGQGAGGCPLALIARQMARRRAADGAGQRQGYHLHARSSRQPGRRSDRRRDGRQPQPDPPAGEQQDHLGHGDAEEDGRDGGDIAKRETRDVQAR
jgi:hypothetical protein